MDNLRGVPPSFGPQLQRARARLTLPKEVGLALRAHRRELRMSQRAYAAHRQLSRSMLARAEAGEVNLSLSAVMELLDGTGFALFLGLGDDPATPPPVDALALEPPVHGPPDSVDEPRAWLPVPPEAWRDTELVARVRGGSRRFPAHRRTHHVTNPPIWWYMHEFFVDPGNPPQWYAPEYDPDEWRATLRAVTALPPGGRTADSHVEPQDGAA